MSYITTGLGSDPSLTLTTGEGGGLLDLWNTRDEDPNAETINISMDACKTYPDLPACQKKKSNTKTYLIIGGLAAAYFLWSGK